MAQEAIGYRYEIVGIPLTKPHEFANDTSGIFQGSGFFMGGRREVFAIWSPKSPTQLTIQDKSGTLLRRSLTADGLIQTNLTAKTKVPGVGRRFMILPPKKKLSFSERVLELLDWWQEQIAVPGD